MSLSSLFFLSFSLAPASSVDTTHSPEVLPNESLLSKYGSQHDLSYTEILSCAHLPYLKDASRTFDIAILGFPFDTTTSYRPSSEARDFTVVLPPNFGGGILDGKLILASLELVFWTAEMWVAGAGYYEVFVQFEVNHGHLSLRWTMQKHWTRWKQLTTHSDTLLNRSAPGGRTAAYNIRTAFMAEVGNEHPRIVTLGGDHTTMTILPILRSPRSMDLSLSFTLPLAQCFWPAKHWAKGIAKE
ncbi:hypothetical protein K435DRAFT_794011 [Dendrothele bispora CBS 962.96]|uniref:Arginase/deacetylase n=1 Tax=Dendrothele bispora (strain CBS 962.96) TaxID=1314807 RepID=A0A4V4HGY9_DENBC|nr:hypothetical protein K435DRAFT_794011 [Dendrothele bispora CBS 962.96]